MVKSPATAETVIAAGEVCPWSGTAAALGRTPRPRIALLSNPKSTRNLAQLSRIREYCAEHPDVFHYEVEHAYQIGEAMRVIARVRPKVLAINGGDGTVQAALTEIYNGGYFQGEPPPVAVLPSGKTNLIALDLGARGDPIEALERLIELARTDLAPYTVARELIALRHGEAASARPSACSWAAPGLPTPCSTAATRSIRSACRPGWRTESPPSLCWRSGSSRRRRASCRPIRTPLRVSVGEKNNALTGQFSLLAVTTLEKLLLNSELGGKRNGTLKFLAIEERPMSLIRGLAASFAGKLGRSPVAACISRKPTRSTSKATAAT